ncbi:hypothetical protein KMT30_37090 [Streptomyces sp. IBSBF 2953]|uniref:hypothetical protein n=1 Tax=Streptomyces TaxID=1883 RepID=UPI00211A266C|nr:hypothetical protein [Streptomyces scabiei]MCQ9184561.1 hypothetical protein [Streptomyces hayashii]MDX3115214.1 hypothetical protein [Streptomyces scabiei]
MENALWGRLTAEARAEVDRLVSARRPIQAVVMMRERAGLPTPDLRECVDLVALRHRVLGLDSTSS